MRNLRIETLALLCLIAVMICLTSCGAGTELESPHLINEEDILTALEASGLEGEISDTETESYDDGHVAYVIRSKTETYLASASAGTIDGEKVFHYTFDKIDIPEEFTWEIWKNQLAFATVLYDGFDDKDALYDALKELPIPESAETMLWEIELPSCYARAHHDERNSKYLDNDGFEVRQHSGTLFLSIYPSKEFYDSLSDKE